MSCKQKQNIFFGLICTNKKRVVGDFATLNMLVNNKGYWMDVGTRKVENSVRFWWSSTSTVVARVQN